MRRSSDGYRISAVDRDSLAAQAGLKPGDVVLSINGTQVNGPEDVDHALQRDFNKSTLLMQVARGRFSYALTFPLD